MDITLNITASPELLNALNRISGVMEGLLARPPKTVIVDIINEEANLNRFQQNLQAPVHISQPQSSIVPTSSKTYTLEQLAVAATQLVGAGKRTELVALLDSFGVQALRALPKEQYSAFAAQLRALGANIEENCQ